MQNEATPTPINAEDRIVIIGVNTILGELILDRLERNPKIQEFWSIDLHPPKTSKKFKKLRFLKMDLIEPGADAKLAEKLKEIGATVLVHATSKNNPSLQWVNAHELEVIGTLNMVSAAKAAQIRKFVFCSTTAVYGASPKNPNYIAESAPLDPHPVAHFVRDKVEAEKQVASLHQDAPQILITTLRFSLIVGPRSKNYFTELFRRRIVPTLLGYDPLMQFLSEDDAADALEKAVLEDFRGIFNIVGRGVVPLSYALREANKVGFPIAGFVAYPVIQILWNLQLLSVPGRLLDYFRYLWVADGEKAKRVMNFEPKMSSKEAFVEFAKYRRLEDYKGEFKASSRLKREDQGEAQAARKSG